MLKRLFALSMLCLVFGVTQAFAQTPAEKAATAKTIKAEKEIEAVLKEAGMDLAAPPLSVKYAPDENEIKRCYEYGKEFAAKIRGGR